MKILFLITLSLLVTISYKAHSTLIKDSAVSSYNIKCGIIMETKGKHQVTKITTDIPFITRQKDPYFNFGCSIKALKNNINVYAIIIIPDSKAKIITSTVDYKTNTYKSNLVIKTDPVSFGLSGHYAMRLDESDLPGEYIVKLYINDKFVKKVVFNIGKKI